jgi:hypothetical protein
MVALLLSGLRYDAVRPTEARTGGGSGRVAGRGGG